MTSEEELDRTINIIHESKNVFRRFVQTSTRTIMELSSNGMTIQESKDFLIGTIKHLEDAVDALSKDEEVDLGQDDIG